jgi:hypothetical protein
MPKIFWTDKRLEAVSKTSLTLFQGFLLAGLLGGVFGKIEALWLKTLFVIAMIMFFALGVIFADKIKEA